MSKLITFEQINAQAAAIDIGAEKIFASPDGITVQSYGTFTSDYHVLVQDFKARGIKNVCMEATGVYWIPLYEMLEEAGMRVCLVNPKEVKQTKGRKTDPKDARWMQKVFAAGLVRESFVPKGKLKDLRMMVRERMDIIEMGSTYVNKMQKCLELMNIKLTSVLSQIHGASGIKMIEAIIDGERNAEQLLLLCDKKIIKAKSEQVLKALEGNYNETSIYLLGQNLHMWKIHQEQLLGIDQKIEEILNEMAESKPEVKALTKPKIIRHHAPQVKDLHQKMLNIYGVDASTISGINNYTLLRLLAEVGADMSRFPSPKHFVSWCQLAPAFNNSGKMNKRVKIKTGSKAGQIFRDIAQGLLNSKNVAIGAFMRRIRARKDSKIAVKAGARKLALAFYNLLVKGSEYVEQGVKQYEEQIKQREKTVLARLAKKHHYQLVTIESA